jgi:radical SAM superfamily enzyme YgiQ (UPF0313 family)
MILHCTPPYAPDVPNAALGYLKGFLQAKGIAVKNVYWNVVLSREITEVQKELEAHSQIDSNFSRDAVVMYIWKHLMKAPTDTKTPLDLLFSSIFSEEEISKVVNSIKGKIDWYSKENNLHEVSLAGFTLKTYQWMIGSYISGRLKELNPEITIVIGGITSESQARVFMNMFDQVDYAIYGDGEYPLLYLARALQTGTHIACVPHLVYRDGDQIHSTATSTEPPLLDEYPFADHSDYFDAYSQFKFNSKVLVPVWGSRSCPWNKCKFCVINEEYTYCARSPETIAAEVIHQSETHDVDTFVFVDTETAGNKKRFTALLNVLIEASANRKEPLRFAATTSPVFIDDETAQLMQAASFFLVDMGFEAVTDSLLEKMEKMHRFAHNIQALKTGKRYKLNIEGLNIIRGIPTETKEDVLESCENLKFMRFLLNQYTFRLTLLGLYKGSPFFKEMPEEKRDKLKHERMWEELAPLDIIPEVDRFEFFGFPPERSEHFPLWYDFAMIMDSLKQQNHTYTWIEYKDGSFIEEKGPRTYKYILDRDETDILIFSDSVRSFSDIHKHVPHISKDALHQVLAALRENGLLYCDNNLQRIISVVDASERICTF